MKINATSSLPDLHNYSREIGESVQIDANQSLKFED